MNAPKLAPGTPGACPDCGWTGGVHNHAAHLRAALAPILALGCCDSCGGTGAVRDPDTNGQCWDCRGTGHPHAPEVNCRG